MMVRNVMIFACGVVIGAGVAVLALKDHYAGQAQQEIDSVKWAFRKDISEQEKDEKPSGLENAPVTVPEKHERMDIPMTSYNSTGGKLARGKEEGAGKLARVAASENYIPFHDQSIYTIPPEVFAMRDGYEKRSLDYYSGNNTLVDIAKKAVVDISSTTGTDALTRFGEYGEDDVVYVRNELTGVDYEVCRTDESMTDIDNIAYSPSE